MASFRMRSQAFVLTTAAAIGAAGAVAAQQTLSFDDWWGTRRCGTHHARTHRIGSGAPDLRRAALVDRRDRRHRRPPSSGCTTGTRSRSTRAASTTRRPAGRAAHLRRAARTGRSSRAMAIVHIAVFDAVNAIVGGYESYTGIAAPRRTASMDAAIAQAAHDTLVALFPRRRAHCDELLAEDLATIRDGAAQERRHRARPARRGGDPRAARDDGSEHAEPRVGIDYIPGDGPGKWRQDPISLIPLALGAHWGEVGRSSCDVGRPVPRAAAAARWTAPSTPRAFDEVKRARRRRHRDADRAHRRADASPAIFWAYDGTPSLCAPPRLYNQIACRSPTQMGTDVVELARLLALVNVAMADAGIAIWESKYHYKFWRPGDRHPRGRRGDRTDRHRRRQPATRRRPDLHAARRAGQQPATGRTSRRRSRPIRPATPASAARCSRRCATSTGPTTSRSRSCRTSSTA